MPFCCSSNDTATQPGGAPDNVVTLVSVDIGLIDFLWENHPHGMHDMAIQVRKTVQECIQRAKCYEVKAIRERTFIACASSHTALRLAIDIQQSVQKVNFGNVQIDRVYMEVEELAMDKGQLSECHASARMEKDKYKKLWNGPRLVIGMDTGIIIRSKVWLHKNRYDYRGEICERACAAEQIAGWGEIFVTQNTYQATDLTRIKNIEFERVGELQLLQGKKRDVVYRINCVDGRPVLTVPEREALRSLDNAKSKYGVAYYDEELPSGELKPFVELPSRNLATAHSSRKRSSQRRKSPTPVAVDTTSPVKRTETFCENPLCPSPAPVVVPPTRVPPLLLSPFQKEISLPPKSKKKAMDPYLVSPRPMFWNGSPTVQYDHAYRCFQEGNGLLFRLVNHETKEWSYYNDTPYYTIHTTVELGKESRFEPLGDVSIPYNPKTQQYEGKIAIPPMTTKTFLKGKIRGYHIGYMADSV